MALRLEGIAIDRVFVLLRRIHAKVHRLAGIRTDAGGDEHQPRKQLAAQLVALRRHEFAGLLAEVKQDRVAVEHGHVAVDNRRHLGIRIDRQKFRLVLLAFAGVDRNGLIGESGFFQKERHLGRVGRAAKVELQHLHTSLLDEAPSKVVEQTAQDDISRIVTAQPCCARSFPKTGAHFRDHA